VLISVPIFFCLSPHANVDCTGDAMKRKAEFTVSDGKMTLILEPAEEGGYLVRSPFDPQLITEAESLEEAFENARDAAEALSAARSKLQIAFATASSKA
jgi:antitoxin HicB